MKNKLQLQDFTFFINILKDSNKWNIDDLTKKLGKDIETIVYMLNIMSEVYSVNGENFIDFEIDSSENVIFFEYSSTFKELTDYEIGYVKEGVGAGGMSILAFLKAFSNEEIVSRCQINIERMKDLGQISLNKDC